jgi:hypothetical protein
VRNCPQAVPADEKLPPGQKPSVRGVPGKSRNLFWQKFLGAGMIFAPEYLGI